MAVIYGGWITSDPPSWACTPGMQSQLCSRGREVGGVGGQAPASLEEGGGQTHRGPGEAVHLWKLCRLELGAHQVTLCKDGKEEWLMISSPGFKLWLIDFVTLSPGLNFNDPHSLHCKILPTS